MSSNDCYEFIFQSNSENEIEKEKSFIYKCMSIKEYVISFLPPKIISYKLYCKYFLFFRRIIVSKSEINNNPFSQNEQLDNNLKNYFNVENFEYNDTNINTFKNKLKEDLKKEHNINDDNKEINISNKMILDFWYFVILEQILFQILIPSMNHIEDPMTFNYYMYENQDKLRKFRFVKFILKDLCEDKGNQYKLNVKIIEKEIKPLYKKINEEKGSKIDNMSPLISLYKDIITGKRKWYKNLRENDDSELLMKFENLSEAEGMLLNLICFSFLANRLVTSPLNPRRGKVTIPYEFDISHAYLKGIRLQQAITLIQFEKQINIVVLKDNTFEYLGMYELAIVSFLNNNIHHVDLTKCMIDQLKLEGFVKGLQHIQAFQDENHFLKISKLNLMSNNCSGKELSQIIQLIPQISILILNQNDDKKIQNKNYFAHLFNILEKLYRKNESNLKCLFLVKCSLTEESLYQLHKLLCSYHCKLKLLALNEVNLCSKMGEKLLNGLKYNRSLEELYLNKTELKDTHSEKYLLNIIPHTFIKKLYLHKNNLSMDNCFRIIAQTQLLDKKIKHEDLIINSYINNIDLSEQKNEANTKEKIEGKRYNKYAYVLVILKILETSGLSLVDITGDIYNLKDLSDSSKNQSQTLIDGLSELLKNGLIVFC